MVASRSYESELDLAFWRHQLEMHQWTARELEAYQAGRLAGRLDSSISQATRKMTDRAAVLLQPRAEWDDLFAQGYDAGHEDAVNGRVRAVMCERCQTYTDDELERLRFKPKQIGAVVWDSPDTVAPRELDEALTLTERRLLLMLMHVYPAHAAYPTLMQVGPWEMGPPGERFHNLRVNFSRVRSKLAAYGVGVEVCKGRGYRLVLIDGEG